MVGKIYKKIDEQNGYIIDENGNLYLFNSFDFLDDTKIIKGIKVKFNVKKDLILRATCIYRLED